jgi:hypothetical protein
MLLFILGSKTSILCWVDWVLAGGNQLGFCKRRIEISLFGCYNWVSFGSTITTEQQTTEITTLLP